MKKCIWCLQLNNDTTEEHIIPETLGCPPEFVFKDGTVCQSCNNKLGHVDQAVINDFDFASFEADIKRKGNRPASIRSRGNVCAGYGAEGKFIFFNMGPGQVKDPSNNIVAPFNGSNRHINATFMREGHLGKVSFDVKFAISKKFRRGIYKIGLNTLAYFLGRNKVLHDDFNPIREFVVRGKGDRTIFIRACENKNYSNQVWPPYVNERNYFSIVLRIAFIEFLMDLSPDCSITPVVYEKSKEVYGDQGWTYMPKNFHHN